MRDFQQVIIAKVLPKDLPSLPVYMSEAEKANYASVRNFIVDYINYSANEYSKFFNLLIALRPLDLTNLERATLLLPLCNERYTLKTLTKYLTYFDYFIVEEARL